MKPFSLLLLLAVATPLAAQQPDSASLPHRDSAVSRHANRDHRGITHWVRRGHQDIPRVREIPFNPARMLAHKEILGLSAEQVTQLTALEHDAKPGMTAAIRQIRTERAAIAAGVNADVPDTVELKRHYEALQAAVTKAHWARLSTSLKARTVLTDAQRNKVRGWAAGRDNRWYSKGHRYRL